MIAPRDRASAAACAVAHFDVESRVAHDESLVCLDVHPCEQGKHHVGSRLRSQMVIDGHLCLEILVDAIVLKNQVQGMTVARSDDGSREVTMAMRMPH